MKYLPVNDALFVEEFETRDDLCGIESGTVLLETAALLDVEHEVSPVQILHHEEQVGLGLESAEQVAEVRVLRAQSEHFTLDHRALHVVVL